MTTTQRGRHRAPRTLPWQRRREPDPLIAWAAGINRTTGPAPGGVALKLTTTEAKA
jgi:hypothetical protein